MSMHLPPNPFQKIRELLKVHQNFKVLKSLVCSNTVVRGNNLGRADIHILLHMIVSSNFSPLSSILFTTSLLSCKNLQVSHPSISSSFQTHLLGILESNSLHLVSKPPGIFKSFPSFCSSSHGCYKRKKLPYIKTRTCDEKHQNSFVPTCP